MIYPRFQLTLVSAQAAIITLVFGIVYAGNFFAFETLRKIGNSAGLPLDNFYYRSISAQMAVISRNTGVAFVLALCLSSLATIYISFKLAGPVWRLRRHFEQIQANKLNDLAPLSFRKGDFHSDLPKIVNSALERLRE